MPDDPTYCFVPVEDPDTGFRQIRIVVGGMDAVIDTSQIVLGIDEAMAIADRLNRPLGWTRESWTSFAAERLRAAGAGGTDLR